MQHTTMQRLENINIRIDKFQTQNSVEIVLPFKEEGFSQNIIRPVTSFQNKIIYRFFKRLFDFFSSLCMLIILAIPMIILAIAIRLDSEGPAIYKQVRLGKDGKPFMLYKYRSMRIDAEKEGARWADSNDPRVTKIGKMLRMKRLDELPQLINIFLGQMSVVGPRPERPEYYKEFRKYIQGFEQRLLVVPGLTGWAQINGGYNILPDQKAELDVEYIENRSFWNDLKIIFRTVKIVLTHDGAR